MNDKVLILGNGEFILEADGRLIIIATDNNESEVVELTADQVHKLVQFLL